MSKSERIYQRIIYFAIPNILSNISIPLLSTVDTWLMGNISILHIGAVGIAAMLFDFIFWNFSFLRISTSGLTAQARGAKDEKEIGQILLRSIIIGLFISVIILILKQPIQDLGIWMLNIEIQHLEKVKTYFKSHF